MTPYEQYKEYLLEIESNKNYTKIDIFTSHQLLEAPDMFGYDSIEDELLLWKAHYFTQQRVGDNLVVQDFKQFFRENRLDKLLDK